MTPNNSFNLSRRTCLSLSLNAEIRAAATGGGQVNDAAGMLA